MILVRAREIRECMKCTKTKYFRGSSERSLNPTKIDIKDDILKCLKDKILIRINIMGVRKEDGISHHQEKWLAHMQGVCTKVSGWSALRKVAKEFSYCFCLLHPSQSFIGAQYCLGRIIKQCQLKFCSSCIIFRIGMWSLLSKRVLCVISIDK